LGRPADSTGQLPRLMATLALASLAVLAGAAGVGYWLAGRVLRPVKVITRTARQISDTDLSKRLNLNTSDELGELANTFDDMLARLQAAFERQRQFTTDASHELRTPLTIIGLETGRENDHMTRLVNDLLVLARMESGQINLEQEKIDLSDVALEVVERLSPLAAAKGVRLDVGELPETPVLGDRGHLGQMVSNLVSNAIKYAPATNGVVTVESGVSGQQAWVKVADNGDGIALEDRPHIFERFYRADKSRSRSEDKNDPGGSGLGLAIVRRIAQAHGGDASLESEPGSGAVFKVTLPLRA
jgi:signal transduction histidine kinase